MKSQPQRVVAFHIARELGMMVEDVLENMTAREFAEWGVLLFPPVRRDSTGDIEEQLKAAFGTVRKEKWQPH